MLQTWMDIVFSGGGILDGVILSLVAASLVYLVTIVALNSLAGFMSALWTGTRMLTGWFVGSPLSSVSRGIFGHWVRSVFIQSVSTASKAEHMRAGFRRLKIKTSQDRSDGHSHPRSSKDRTDCNNAMDDFIRACGYRPYSISESTRDIRAGNQGTRLYFTAKDLAMEVEVDDIDPDHAFKFMDTDYYGDVLETYIPLMRPILAYTFVPRKVAGHVPDASYTIHGNDIIFTGDGGAKYQHPVWDYDTDHVVVHVGSKSYVYLVESIRTSDPDRRLVFLAPVKKISCWLGRLLPGFTLKRRVFTNGNLNMTRYHEDGKTMVSVGRPNLTYCVALEEPVLAACLIRGQEKKLVNIADIERVLGSHKVPDAGTAAPLLYEMLADIHNVWRVPLLTNTGKAPEDDIHYQTLYPLMYEDGTPTVRKTIEPLVSEPNVAPMRSYNNDTSCVANRVTAVRNRAPAWPAIYNKYKNEFVDLLIPVDKIHTGIPRSIEEVMQLQNRPSQRSSALAALPFAFMWQTMVKSFQKTETYNKIAPPRNISQLDADHRTRYGSYIMQFTQAILKPQRWYAFSKTPYEISREVMRVAAGAEIIVPTDFSAWDGTHSEDLAKFEQELCLRYFMPQHHQEVTKLLMSQYNAKAVTKFGVKYNTAWSRLSGSSDTSAFNSVDNALVAFFTLREMGYEAPAAWKRLGLFGGDDGLFADVNTTILKRVVTRMGHVIKIEKKLPGEPVPFLGRYYLDPWVRPDSVSDTQRSLRKIHLTSAPANVPALEGLYCKAQGLWVTDRQTPLLSQLSRKIMDIIESGSSREIIEGQLDKHAAYLKEDRSWFAQYDAENEVYPQADLWHPEAMAFVADQLNTTVGHLEEVIRAIEAADSLAQLPVRPFTVDRAVTVEATLGGEIHRPKSDPTIQNDGPAEPALVQGEPPGRKQLADDKPRGPNQDRARHGAQTSQLFRPSQTRTWHRLDGQHQEAGSSLASPTQFRGDGSRRREVSGSPVRILSAPASRGRIAYSGNHTLSGPAQSASSHRDPDGTRRLMILEDSH